MSDIFDKEKRTLIMRSIKGKNSKAEKIVFKFLRAQNVYFQKHYPSKLKVNIDIALPRKKLAVFVDGDFWHGASLEKLLEQRGVDDYWTKKIKRNFERDRQQDLQLASQGWQVLRIWESDLIRVRTRAETLAKIYDFLKQN